MPVTRSVGGSIICTVKRTWLLQNSLFRFRQQLVGPSSEQEDGRGRESWTERGHLKVVEQQPEPAIFQPEPLLFQPLTVKGVTRKSHTPIGAREHEFVRKRGRLRIRWVR